MSKTDAQLPYDLFVSYVAADREWVEGYLLDALSTAGVRVHSEAAFALGAPRLEEFQRAVKQSTRTLLVLSQAYLSDSLNQFVNLMASAPACCATRSQPPLIRRLERRRTYFAVALSSATAVQAPINTPFSVTTKPPPPNLPFG